MCIDEGAEKTFGVIPRACQLFGEVRLACRVPLLGAKQTGVWSYVRDANAVRSSITPLEEAAAYPLGVVQVVWDIA